MGSMRQKWIVKVLSGALLTTVFLGGQMPAEAKSKDIRVALFIDTGVGYRGVVPSVTLTSEQGMDVTLYEGSSEQDLPEIEDEAARFRVDEFHLVVVQTPDWDRAQQVAQQLSQKKYEGTIQVVKLGGQTVYQVVSGSFGTYQAAVNQANTVSAAIGQMPVVKGPYRLEAGRYDSLEAAEKQAKSFADADVPAYAVAVMDGSDLEYAVWFGDETSEEDLSSLKKTLSSKYPRDSFRKANSDTYVVMKEDAYGSAEETIAKYVFSPDAKLVMEANGEEDALIGVNERAGRTYRGKMEVSSYNGYLTLVNELPMEQYLYSVVGSEMAPGWPEEALKTQAVLARTRAVGFDSKYGVADLSDTVYEQAYYGYEKESDDVRKAVDDTEGEVITYQGKLVEALYYSNAGGMTADGTEVWGNSVPYLRPVTSNDAAPQAEAYMWYHVSLADGRQGYVRSDLVTVTGATNAKGMREATVTTDNSNLRTGPGTSIYQVLTTMPAGTVLTIMAEVTEDNPYSWARGPYTAEEITAMINASQARNNAPLIQGTVKSLKVTKRGPSGRVLEMEANGQTIAVSSPDAHRSVFQAGGTSLPSTKFDVEEVRDKSNQGTMFLFRGTGFGHGLGVSQYGAKAMAESGYDYKEILQHYYQGVNIERQARD